MAPPPPELLDHPLVGRRYFFPRRARVRSPLVVEAGDARLECALHAVAPGAPTVVHFHGNGEVAADWEDDLPRIFAALGWNLLLAEYRGYGGSTGAPLLGRMLDDVAPIVRAAGVPPERIVAFGRSVGSIFAIEAAAAFPSLAGLVVESGVADPLERLLMRLEPAELGASPDDLAAACARRLDHRRKLGAYPGPLLVLHAVWDDLVPIDNAERIAAWAAGPVELRRLERGDHNSVLAANGPEYLRAVAEFLASVAPER